MQDKICETCYYWREMTPSENACHYLLDEKQSRGCPAENCTKWKPKRAERKDLKENFALGARGLL